MLICNQPVRSSNPLTSSKEFKALDVFHLRLFYCLKFSKYQIKDINSPRRHEIHEEKLKQNLRVLRVFVVKCLNLMSMRRRIAHPQLSSSIVKLGGRYLLRIALLVVYITRNKFKETFFATY